MSDTGPGLSDLVQKRLFQPFVTTKAEGLGVGLSICQTIVEAHGGDIVAENRSTGGATFRFTVPAPKQSSDTNRSDPSTCAAN